MSVGNYSPTVSGWYAADPEWFIKNGGGLGNGFDPESDTDDEGYDRYGYSDYDEDGAYVLGGGVDRAGYTETDYLLDSKSDEGYDLYNTVQTAWWKTKPLR